MTSTGLPTANGIGWFQIGVEDGAAAERFYGDVFGWTFKTDETAGMPYRIVTTPSARSIMGGIVAHGGQMPNHAIFCVVVDDVADTCRRVEAAGGKVIVPPTTTPTGLVFANLLDPEGNHVGVYRPEPGSET
jgi:hypothetical protein